MQTQPQQPPIQGHSHQSSRSMSISMEDSVLTPMVPVIQKMDQMNQQQMCVRKPMQLQSITEIRNSESASSSNAIQMKSPISSNIILHQPSDRPRDENCNDLLLINEEPSVKEQSYQLDHKQTKFKTNHIQLSIDQKQKSPLNEVLWSRVVSSQSLSISFNKHQLSLISDNAVTLMDESKIRISHIIKYCFQPIEPFTPIYQAFNILYCIWVIVTTTIIMLEIANNNYELLNQSYFQYLLFVLYLVQCIQESRIIVYQDGIRVSDVFTLIRNYLRKNLIIDLIAIVPFWIYQSEFDVWFPSVLYLMGIRKVITIRDGFSSYYSEFHQFIQALWKIIEFHLISTFALMLILLLGDQQTGKSSSYLLMSYGSIKIFTIIVWDNQAQQIVGYIIQLILLMYYLHIVVGALKQDPETVDVISQLKKQKINGEQLMQLSTYLNGMIKQKESIKQQNLIDLLQPNQQEQLKYTLYSHLLRRINVFNLSFTEATMKRITSLLQEFVVPPNQILLLPETSNQSLYFILEGEVQIFQQAQEHQFKIAILKPFSIFNHSSFFKNQMPNIGAVSIGYVKLVQLEYSLFQDLITKLHVEKQRYCMYFDKMTLYQRNDLCCIKCYACGKDHDIDDCPTVHYIPNKSMLVNYINFNEPNIRQKHERFLKEKHRDKKSRARIEEAAQIFQQFNLSSDLSNDEHFHRQLADDLPSIQKQLTTPFTAPVHDPDDKQPSISAIPPSQGSNKEELKSSHSQHVADFHNISPVSYVQQPPSQFSHSSYGFLLKDQSINMKKGKAVEGSDKERNSSNNMFSIPYSSSNTSKNRNNKDQSKFSDIVNNNINNNQVPEISSVQLQKQSIQDSFYFHQKRIQVHKDSGDKSQSGDRQPPIIPEEEMASQNSKLLKYKTAISLKRRDDRSERKSNSMVNEYNSSHHDHQQQQQQQVNSNQKQLTNEDQRQSKYGMASSKFTGETAKQFMKNPFEMLNVEFNQSFENNHQFSDYFPLNNVDYAIESYKNFQASKSSNYKYN